jgi:hypothetical protein
MHNPEFFPRLSGKELCQQFLISLTVWVFFEIYKTIVIVFIAFIATKTRLKLIWKWIIFLISFFNYSFFYWFRSAWYLPSSLVSYVFGVLNDFRLNEIRINGKNSSVGTVFFMDRFFINHFLSAKRSNPFQKIRCFPIFATACHSWTLLQNTFFFIYISNFFVISFGSNPYINLFNWPSELQFNNIH